MSLKRVSILCAMLMLFSITIGKLQAADLLVPSQYANLQAAVDAAGPTDRIVIADGVHSGPDFSAVVDGKSVEIVGASRNAVIDLQGSGSFLTTGPQQIFFNSSIQVRCLEFRNGSMADPVIQATGGFAIVENCQFNFGSGLAVDSAVSISLKRCEFTGNTGHVVVRSSYVITAIECRFEDGTGAAIESLGSFVTLQDCEFFNHDVGVHSTGPGWVYVDHTQFFVCRVGLDVVGSENFFVDRCRFHWNGQAVSALDIAQGTLANSIVAQNGNGGTGGSIVEMDLVDPGATPFGITVQHCTFADNTGGAALGLAGGTGSVQVNNSILWNPGMTLELQMSGIAVAIGSNLIRGGIAGTGVLDVDPQFTRADSLQLDYSLSATSPAIDSGAVVPFYPYDIDGVPHNQDAFRDLGACEHAPKISKISFLGWTELLFFGQPGQDVILAISDRPEVGVPAQTPFGEFWLDPQNHAFLGVIGTTGSNGVLSVTYTTDIGNPSEIIGQALIGTTFTMNFMRLDTP